jgi:hypothetical protein
MLTLLLAAAPAAALDGRPPGGDGGRAGGIDPAQAAAAVRRATGARVLGVQRDGAPDNGYRVRVLTPDGTVRSIRVDRRSGRILD